MTHHTPEGLPPLPTRERFGSFAAFTADQMQAYAREALRARDAGVVPVIDKSVVRRLATQMGWTPPAHVPADVEAYMVHGRYERCAFRHLSSAEAYMSGLLKTDPEGGYVIKPLVYAQHPTPEPVQAVDIDALIDAHRWDTTEGRRALVRAALAARQPQAQQGGEN